MNGEFLGFCFRYRRPIDALSILSGGVMVVITDPTVSRKHVENLPHRTRSGFGQLLAST